MSVDCEDNILHREIDPAKISRCLRKLKNNKTGGSDGLVGELLKYGGSGIGLDKLFLFSCPLFFLTILIKLAHYSYALYPLFPHTIPIILMSTSKKDKFSLKKAHQY